MKYLLLTLQFLLPVTLLSNNIEVSNVAIQSQNTVDDYYMISMDVSWENSWRTSTYESNWDAAWIFLKYTIKDQQAWGHGTLHYVDGTNDGHVVPAGCTIRTSNNTYGDATHGVGVFIYRSADGIGDVSFEEIELRWDYGENGLDDDDIIEISVNAIEMVYVPQGSFYLGDGLGDFGQFEAGNTGNPYEIASENAITLGGVNVNNLSNNDGMGMIEVDDFDYNTTQNLPADFPKGYNAFYMMKYEASRGQYAEFLRRLTSSQRNTRNGPVIKNGVDVYPILNGDHWAEANFPWRPMNYINWVDISAYLDWSGLRPPSELEFEKSCRGPKEPVEGEYAWGNSSWYNEKNYTFHNEGTPQETINVGMGEGVGNANSLNPYSGENGPVRCGIFAASAINKTRQETGATYYGIMEATGNVYETMICVGSSQSRDFSGLHGDGNLPSSGNASFTLLTDWAFGNSIGAGWRGNKVSNRVLANNPIITKESFNGFRGVRTAQ